jgi:hypothetical protein
MEPELDTTPNWVLYGLAVLLSIVLSISSVWLIRREARTEDFSRPYSSHVEREERGDKAIEIVRVKITDAGPRALQ